MLGSHGAGARDYVCRISADVGVVIRGHLEQELPTRGCGVDIRVAPLEGFAREPAMQLFHLQFDGILPGHEMPTG